MYRLNSVTVEITDKSSSYWQGSKLQGTTKDTEMADPFLGSTQLK